MSLEDIVLHIITGLVSVLAGGGSVAWFMIRAQRRKTNAEADMNISTAWEKFAANLQEQLQKRKTEAEADVNISTAWEKFSEELQGQLKEERELRLTLQGRVDEMSKQLSELHATIAQQGAELLRVREENIGLKKELAVAREESANLREESANQRTAIDSVMAENSRLGRELVEERRKRQTLETKLNRLMKSEDQAQPPSQQEQT